MNWKIPNFIMRQEIHCTASDSKKLHHKPSLVLNASYREAFILEVGSEQVDHVNFGVIIAQATVPRDVIKLISSTPKARVATQIYERTSIDLQVAPW